MDYPTAVAAARRDLATDTPCDGAAMQAALALAIAGWSTLRIDEPAWDGALLDLLDVAASLYPYPQPLTLHLEPSASRNQSRRVLLDLLESIGQRYERGAADTGADPARRLRWAAAGLRLATALQGLS